MRKFFVNKLAITLIPCLCLGLNSCNVKQKRTPFPYADALKADTLGCYENSESKVVTLPSEPDNGMGVILSDFDSELSEGILTSESKDAKECDKSNALLPFNDPLMKCQWHLSNRGDYIQKFPSSSHFSESGAIGADLKLLKILNEKTLLENFKGTGYKVHISDSGIEYNHEDLSANYNAANSYDFCDADKYPQPRPHKGESSVTSDHGTSVAGIIASISNNLKGGVGIVSQAQISADNAVSTCDLNASTWLKTLKQSGISIWSGSFGTDTHVQHDSNASGYEIINDAISGHIVDYTKDLDTTTPNPSAYFKAAGNEGYQGGNANRDPMGWNPWIAQIASGNHLFEKTSYTSPGSNILVTGLGAGDGAGAGVCTTAFGNTYTCDFNGTSSATPQVAAVALMIKEAGAKAGKNLTPLDLYYILARTAVPVDETKESASGFLNKKYLNYSVNSAKYRHSVYYGFGVVNAEKAVKLAQSEDYSPLPPNLQSLSKTSSTCSKLKFKTNNTCAIHKIAINRDFQVFSSQISISVVPNYDSFESTENVIGQVFGFIIQPDGTRSELVRTNSRLLGSVYTHNQFFKSYAPFATNAKGDWYIELCARGNQGGEYFFNSANLKLYGFDGKFPMPEKP